MIYMIKDAGGNWVEGMPTIHGQLYRIYFNPDFWVETYWQDPNSEVTE